MTRVLTLDSPDLEIVRWHECGRRTSYSSGLEAALATKPGEVSYTCSWDPSHYHAGRVSKRRRSGPSDEARRVDAARYNLAKYIAAQVGLIRDDVEAP